MQVSGPSAALTLTVGLDGFRLVPPPHWRVVGGTLGPFSLDGYEGDLVTKGDELRCELRAKPNYPAPRPGLREMFRMDNPTTRLVLADGSEVTAEFSDFDFHSARIDPAAGTHDVTGRLNLAHWVHGVPSEAWIAPLRGGRIDLRRGNLLLLEGDETDPVRSSITNLRLEGNYVWHVVSREKKCFVVVDPQGQPLEPPRMRDDFYALQVTLGSPLRLDVLTGVDAEGQPRSWAGPLSSGHRRIPSYGNERIHAVPESHGTDVWEPLFFRALTTSMSARDATPIYMALHALLGAMPGTNTIDGMYLQLQVTLEALSRYDDPDPPSLVKDEAKWRDWVAKLRPEVETHATDVHAADVLLHKMKYAYQSRRSTDAVINHLNSLALRVPEALLDELPGRHQSAHRLLMNPNEERRIFQRDIERIAKVRTLLLAVLAKRCGYAGPISGWVPGDFFGIPDWWPVDARLTEVARTKYICSRVADRKVVVPSIV